MEAYVRENAANRGTKWDDMASGCQQMLLSALLGRPLTQEEVYKPKRSFTFTSIRALLPRNPGWQDVCSLLAYGASISMVRSKNV